MMAHASSTGQLINYLQVHINFIAIDAILWLIFDRIREVAFPESPRDGQSHGNDPGAAVLPGFSTCICQNIAKKITVTIEDTHWM